MVPVFPPKKFLPKKKINPREQMLSRYSSMNLDLPEKLEKHLPKVSALKTYTRTPLMSSKSKSIASSSEDKNKDVKSASAERPVNERKRPRDDGSGSSNDLSASAPGPSKMAKTDDTYLPVLTSMAKTAMMLKPLEKPATVLKTYSRKEKITDDRKETASSSSGNIQRTAHQAKDPSSISSYYPDPSVATKIPLNIRASCYNKLKESYLKLINTDGTEHKGKLRN